MALNSLSSCLCLYSIRLLQKNLVLEEMQVTLLFLDKILCPLLWFEYEVAHTICLNFWSPGGCAVLEAMEPLGGGASLEEMSPCR